MPMPRPMSEIHQPNTGPSTMRTIVSAAHNGQMLLAGKKPSTPAPSAISASRLVLRTVDLAADDREIDRDHCEEDPGEQQCDEADGLRESREVAVGAPGDQEEQGQRREHLLFGSHRSTSARFGPVARSGWCRSNAGASLRIRGSFCLLYTS